MEPATQLDYAPLSLARLSSMLGRAVGSRHRRRRRLAYLPAHRSTLAGNTGWHSDWVSVSFVHHVVLQRISHFTVGKFAVRLQLTYPDGSRRGIVGLFLM